MEESPSASRRSTTRTVRECESRSPCASFWIGRPLAHSCSATSAAAGTPESPAASVVAARSLGHAAPRAPVVERRLRLTHVLRALAREGSAVVVEPPDALSRP